MPSSPARDLIARLEATAEQQDDLTARLIHELKAWDDERARYIEAIERHAQTAVLARSSMLAEAAVLINPRHALPRRPGSAVQ